MKTKIFKFVLSVFTIVMAVTFAFATETNTVSQTAYYNHPVLGVQSVIVGNECQDQAGFQCKFNGYPLFAEMALETPLRKINP